MRIASAAGNGAQKKNPTILCVGLSSEEHDFLRCILRSLDCEWRLQQDAGALPQLIAANDIAVIVFDEDFAPGLWKEYLLRLRWQESSPPVVVTSRLADERLWAEALNLGAYDLLTKPFEQAEAARVLHLAFLRRFRTQAPITSQKAAVA